MKRISVDAFDPTPEESAKAERAKPLKIPLCIRCKVTKRAPVTDTALTSAAFLSLSTTLRFSSDKLTRAQIDNLKHCHGLLVRASKARYCKTCLVLVVEYVEDQIKNMSS